MRPEYDFRHSKRGPVEPMPTDKVRITIRIDVDVLEWFRQQVHRAGGGNYQTLINRALRDHIRRQQEPLEDILRRIIREELPSPGYAASSRASPPQARSNKRMQRTRAGSHTNGRKRVSRSGPRR